MSNSPTAFVMMLHDFSAFIKKTLNLILPEQGYDLSSCEQSYPHIPSEMWIIKLEASSVRLFQDARTGDILHL